MCLWPSRRTWGSSTVELSQYITASPPPYIYRRHSATTSHCMDNMDGIDGMDGMDGMAFDDNQHDGNPTAMFVSFVHKCHLPGCKICILCSVFALQYITFATLVRNGMGSLPTDRIYIALLYFLTRLPHIHFCCYF